MINVVDGNRVKYDCGCAGMKNKGYADIADIEKALQDPTISDRALGAALFTDLSTSKADLAARETRAWYDAL